MKSTASSLIHTNIFKRFTGLIKAGRLAHAYLFTGPNGIGKVATALALARLVNCEKTGAENCACSSCVKIASGNHADVFVIEKLEDKTEIGIDQVREGVIPKLGLRPIEGRWRVCIIKDADLLSEHAANAFLKTLEEPTPHTLLILVTAAPGRMMRTITSRCHEVRFFPMSNAELASKLKNEYDVASVEADLLAKFSGGSPGRAAQMRDGFLEDKNAYLNEFVFSPANEVVFKKFAADKDLTRELCGVLLTFFRDLLLLHSGAGEEAIFHRDRLVDLRRLAPKYAPADLERIISQIVQVRQAADENFNVKIALMVLREMI
ncbi:MAG: DNA polymerase III subunit delta' [Candidatus Omnitrophica bacterium]|nr:DNA polymerase III subunit delta' [Candidatus Omnitrophota bacterium]